MLSGCLDDNSQPQALESTLPLLAEISVAALKTHQIVATTEPGEYGLVRLVGGPDAWTRSGNSEQIAIMSSIDAPDGAEIRFMSGFYWRNEDYPWPASVDFYALPGPIMSGLWASASGTDGQTLEMAWLVGSDTAQVTLSVGLLDPAAGFAAWDELGDRPPREVAWDSHSTGVLAGTVFVQRSGTEQDVLWLGGNLTHETTASTLDLPVATVGRETRTVGSGPVTGPGVLSVWGSTSEVAAAESWRYAVSAPGIEASHDDTAVRDPVGYVPAYASFATGRGHGAGMQVHGTTRDAGVALVELERSVTGFESSLVDYDYEFLTWGWAPVELDKMYDWKMDDEMRPTGQPLDRTVSQCIRVSFVSQCL